MQATVEFPEAVLRELEALARSEGTTTAQLIRRIVEAHMTTRQKSDVDRFAISFPLIPASETGLIQPLSGRNVDELLLRDDFSS